MYRFLFNTGNVIFSVLLGALAMTLFALNFEEWFKHILTVAEHVKAWLLSLPISTRYHNFVRLFLHESSFVFAFFTIAARMVVSLIGSTAVWAWERVR
jgi:hypothetical protein